MCFLYLPRLEPLLVIILMVDTGKDVKHRYLPFRCLPSPPALLFINPSFLPYHTLLAALLKGLERELVHLETPSFLSRAKVLNRIRNSKPVTVQTVTAVGQVTLRAVYVSMGVRMNSNFGPAYELCNCPGD